VYGIEADRIIDVAREAAERAGLNDRVEFIEAYSTDVTLPERADIVLFEDFTSLLFHASVGLIIRDARERFLKPGGTLVPQSADLWMAPFEQEDLYDTIDRFGENASHLYGFDFSAMREMAVNSITYHAFEPEELLAEPAHAQHVDFATDEAFECRLQQQFTARRDGVMHGVAVWFEAQIAPDVRMSNAPGQETTIWHQGVLPLEYPTQISAGDSIEVRVETVRSEEHGFFWNWTTRIADNRGEALPVIYRQSTFRSAPLPEELAEALRTETGA
jgi:protein arginine N-methyltransferase 1